MHVLGKIENISRTLDGDLEISFRIENDQAVEQAQNLQDNRLVIDVKKYREKRSLDANAYLWQLLDKMAKTLGTDKWSVYLMELSRYGVFTDVDIKRDALPLIKRQFRYVEEFDDDYEEGERVIARCYYGSSGYNTKEMSELIDGVVSDANEIGVETLTPDELAELISKWEVNK